MQSSFMATRADKPPVMNHFSNRVDVEPSNRKRCRKNITVNNVNTINTSERDHSRSVQFFNSKTKAYTHPERFVNGRRTTALESLSKKLRVPALPGVRFTGKVSKKTPAKLPVYPSGHERSRNIKRTHNYPSERELSQREWLEGDFLPFEKASSIGKDINLVPVRYRKIAACNFPFDKYDDHYPPTTEEIDNFLKGWFVVMRGPHPGQIDVNLLELSNPYEELNDSDEESVYSFEVTDFVNDMEYQDVALYAIQSNINIYTPYLPDFTTAQEDFIEAQRLHRQRSLFEIASSEHQLETAFLNGANGEVSNKDDVDKVLVCNDCTLFNKPQVTFVWTAKSQAYYASKKFDPPRRCPTCQKERKANPAYYKQMVQNRKEHKEKFRRIKVGEEILSVDEYNERIKMEDELTYTIPMVTDRIPPPVVESAAQIVEIERAGYKQTVNKPLTQFEQFKLQQVASKAEIIKGDVPPVLSKMPLPTWKEVVSKTKVKNKVEECDIVSVNSYAALQQDEDYAPEEENDESKVEQESHSPDLIVQKLVEFREMNDIQSAVDLINQSNASKYESVLLVLEDWYEFRSLGDGRRKKLMPTQGGRINEYLLCHPIPLYDVDDFPPLNILPLHDSQEPPCSPLSIADESDLFSEEKQDLPFFSTRKIWKDDFSLSTYKSVPKNSDHMSEVSGPPSSLISNIRRYFNKPLEGGEDTHKPPRTNKRTPPPSSSSLSGSRKSSGDTPEESVDPHQVAANEIITAFGEVDQPAPPPPYYDEVRLQQPRAKVVVYRGFISCDGGYYRHQPDSGLFLEYSNGQYGPNCLDRSFVLVPPGVLLKSHIEEAGIYIPQKLDEVNLAEVYTTSPLRYITNMVVEARAHRWFSYIRVLVPDLVNVLSFDSFYKKDVLYARKTKFRMNALVDFNVLSLLRSKYSAQAYSENGVNLLRNSCESLFPHVPREILSSTLIYYLEDRAITRRNDFLTCQALAEHVSSGRYTHINPINNLEYNPIYGFDGLTSEGVHAFTSTNEAEQYHKSGYTCVQRIHHQKSSVVHGSADAQKVLSNRRFDTADNAKNFFLDGAYPRLPQHIMDENKASLGKHYTTFGGGFANACQIVDTRDYEEINKAMLRLTGCRNGEFTLRQKQALLGNRINERLNCQEANEVLSKEIRRYVDRPEIYEKHTVYPTYRVDALEMLGELDKQEDENTSLASDQCIAATAVLQPSLEPSPLLVNILTGVFRIKQKSLLALSDALEAINKYEETNLNYFKKIGTKLPERMRMLKQYMETPPVDVGQKRHQVKMYNTIQPKPDEFQKIKKGDLKYARATVNISGMDLMHANPALMYTCKHIISTPLIIRQYGEDVHIEYDGLVEVLSNIKIPRTIYIRSVIKETTSDKLQEVMNEMLDYGDGHDMFVGMINHGDDMLFAEKSEETVHYPRGYRFIEGDIEKNDTSYTHELINAIHTATFPAVPGVTPAFAQLAKDCIIDYKNSDIKAIMKNTQGMMLCSGSSLTTFLNSTGSSLIGISYGLSKSTDTLAGAASEVGFLVTSVSGDLSDTTFLSKGFYYTQNLAVRSYKCLASICRSFGHVHGDLLGSSKTPPSKRWNEHISGVIESEKHEPDSLFMTALRCWNSKDTASAIYNKMKLKFSTLRLGKSYTSGFTNLPEIDQAIIDRYYPGETALGYCEYIQLIEYMKSVNDLYGNVIMSPFVDRIMKKRYGLAPVCA